MYLVFFQQAGYSILFSQKFIENATIFLYKSKKCSIICLPSVSKEVIICYIRG